MCQGSSLDKPDMGKPPEEWGPAEHAEYQRVCDEIDHELELALAGERIDLQIEQWAAETNHGDR